MPQRQGIAGNAAVVEGERSRDAVQKACRGGAAEGAEPQRQGIAGFAAVVVGTASAHLRKVRRKRGNSVHLWKVGENVWCAEYGEGGAGLHEDDGDIAGTVGADDKGLLDVGGLGGAGDEAAEVVGVEVFPGVGFVHVAHYLLSVQQDDEGFGDE